MPALSVSHALRAIGFNALLRESVRGVQLRGDFSLVALVRLLLAMLVPGKAKTGPRIFDRIISLGRPADVGSRSGDGNQGWVRGNANSCTPPTGAALPVGQGHSGNAKRRPETLNPRFGNPESRARFPARHSGNPERVRGVSRRHLEFLNGDRRFSRAVLEIPNGREEFCDLTWEILKGVQDSLHAVQEIPNGREEFLDLTGKC